MMRRGVRLPAAELAPYLFEVDLPNKPPVEVLRNQRVEDALAPSPSAIDWSRLFGNSNPVEIEVGFGKGLFLVNAAQARPQTNFFGVEIERKYTLFTATRLAKRALKNVKVAAGDARPFLHGHVGDGSVSAMHVYFPDPWWKNRHRKRRLFTEEFAAQCVRVLTGSGYLHFVSDVREYFEETLLMLGQVKALVQTPAPEVKDPSHEMDFLTNFERKYRREGRPIYRSVWRRQQ